MSHTRKHASPTDHLPSFFNSEKPCTDKFLHRSTCKGFALRMLLAMKLCNVGTTRKHFTIFFNFDQLLTPHFQESAPSAIWW